MLAEENINDEATTVAEMIMASMEKFERKKFMINWISADNPPKECNMAKEYIVTVKYDGIGNVNGRKTLIMTYQEKGKKKNPTWCWNDRISIWKVLYWSELPEPCQK